MDNISDKPTIFFIWLGESNSLPEYAKWNIENFKKINPDFDVKLFQIDESKIFSLNTSSQLDVSICNGINLYKQQLQRYARSANKDYNRFKNAKIAALTASIRVKIAECFCKNRVLFYYFDLDCFPTIGLTQFVKNYFLLNLKAVHTTNDKETAPIMPNINYYVSGSIFLNRSDIWSLNNNKYLLENDVKFLQIHKDNFQVDKITTRHCIPFANNDIAEQFTARRKKFQNMQLDLEKDGCIFSNIFTPVEHYRINDYKNNFEFFEKILKHYKIYDVWQRINDQ